MVRGISCCVVLVLCVAACPADGTTQQPDAASVGPDAPGAPCTGALYDTCTSDTQCDSHNCQVFSAVNLHVCSQACSATNPCPMKDGMAVPCTANGFCRPAGSSGCDLQ
jgi:hypothetical protein